MRRTEEVILAASAVAWAYSGGLFMGLYIPAESNLLAHILTYLGLCLAITMCWITYRFRQFPEELSELTPLL